MKKTLIAIASFTILTIAANAQVIDDVNGKTYYYYDSLTNKKVKEIFHHTQEIKITTDHKGNVHDTLYLIKNGPYTRYYENGNLECSGYYDDEKKTGTWKYYDPKGKLVRTELWASNKITKTIKN